MAEPAKFEYRSVRYFCPTASLQQLRAISTNPDPAQTAWPFAHGRFSVDVEYRDVDKKLLHGLSVTHLPGEDQMSYTGHLPYAANILQVLQFSPELGLFVLCKAPRGPLDGERGHMYIYVHRNEVFEWPPNGKNVEATTQPITFDLKTVKFEPLAISYKQSESIGPLGVVKLDTTDPQQQLAAFGSRISAFERRNKLMMDTLRAQERAEAAAARAAAAAAAAESLAASCGSTVRNMSPQALILAPIFDPQTGR